MSTEQQIYSIERQSAANHAYAADHGFEIVRTYSDAGISGLTLHQRPALQQLIADVVAGRPGYEAVLVYDVSRWGRFQDPDESAHYEFLCRSAGVRVEYCAEPFSNDGSLTAGVLKQLKRAMAAEYSRELSVRISQAQRGLAAKGFWQGGPCGYGFRRQLVQPSGTPGRILEHGEQKSLRTERVILVEGPLHELETVRRIFHLYVTTGLKPWAIAHLLNEQGVTSDGVGDWSGSRVRRLLADEKYGGELVQGRTASTLGSCRRAPRERWVRAAGGCPALVDPQYAAVARKLLRKQKPRASDQELLQELRHALQRHGSLSRGVLESEPDCHGADTYKRRFGSLIAAFQAAGYEPSRQQLAASAAAHRNQPCRHRTARRPPTEAELLQQLSGLLAERGRLSVELIAAAAGVAHPEVFRRRFGGMRRVYALAGYHPTDHQEHVMDARGGQVLSRGEAERLCRGAVIHRREDGD